MPAIVHDLGNGRWAMGCCSGHQYSMEYGTEDAACQAAKKHNEQFREYHLENNRRWERRERREQRQQRRERRRLREQQNASASAQANTAPRSWADVVKSYKK
jgi:Ni/Co efflux regulator RcnB